LTDLLSGLRKAKLEAYNLPYDLSISTATITCKINVMFNVANIAYYFNDFDDIVIGKKYGNRIINNLVNIKKLKTGKKKKRKEKKNFFNQVSLIFRSATLMGFDPDTLSQKEKFKNINVKLFINGSIQMTGCKHLDNIKKCLEILFEKLKVTKAILNKDLKFEKITFVKSIECLNMDKINLTVINDIVNNIDDIDEIGDDDVDVDVDVEVDVDDDDDEVDDDEVDDDEINDEVDDELDDKVDDDITNHIKKTKNQNIILKNNFDNFDNFDMKKLDIKNIYMFEIRMINTNFNIGFQINRKKLHQLLMDHGYDASFDPIIHACVNIKYNIKQLNKTVSIFVFESGSITIAGSNSCYQILLTYNFINKFILSNYNYLLSKSITPQLIIQLIQNMK
jgi:TATA-box binding protein (TBP) (component of TFIID and TFIIIB)